jgi:hypothetical protein
VHAARFQPTHLAQLMRELFPTEAGGHGARVNTTMSGSQSRPHSSGRSPTIPPLSVPRAPSRATLPRIDPMPTPPPRRSFLARGSTWGALALGVIGVGVGVVVTRHAAPPVIDVAGTPAPVRDSLPRKFEVAVRSIPDGADIYLLGENNKLGTTDTYLAFERKNDERISLVFKKEGYHDAVKEVTQYPMLIQLRAVEDGEHRQVVKPPEPDKRDREPAPAPVAPTIRPSPSPGPSGQVTPTPPTTPGSGTPSTVSPPAVTPPAVAPPPVAPETAPGQPARERPRDRRRTPNPNDLISPF